MSPGLRWVQHSANLLVSGTGIVYFGMKFLLEPVDEWAVVNHPWQPLFQHLHLLLAPLLVFSFGLLFQAHVVARWRLGKAGRWTGLGLALTFGVMAASGYGLQVSATETWRTAHSTIHLISSATWILLTAAHFVVALRMRRNRQAMADLLQAQLAP